MGSQDGRKLDERDSRRKKAEERKGAQRSARLDAMRGQAGAVVADWASVPQDLLCRLVSVVTASDAMISFSYSRDGGAYCISIYDNGDKERVWLPCTSDMDFELRRLIEFWT